MSENTITVRPKPSPLAKTPDEQKLEEKRRQDILLLVESLFIREEATVKLILDCLYDVGSVNIINKKFTSKPTNKLLKYIARFSKPIFRLVAIRWFHKNCPKLLTNWLFTKISFR